MTETFNYKNYKLKIVNGENFSLNQLKSRLHQMGIPFNENEKKKKSYYSQLYNQSIRNNNNKMKIINLLINDSIDDPNNLNLKRELIKEENTIPQKIPKLNETDFHYNQETSQKNPNSNNFINMMNYNYNNNNNMYNNNVQNQFNPQRNISNNNFNNDFKNHNTNRIGINNNLQNGNEGNHIKINQNIHNQFHNLSPNKDNINNYNNINTQYHKYTNYQNNPNQNYYKTNNVSYNTPVQNINENQDIHHHLNQNNLNQTTNQLKNNNKDYNGNKANNIGNTNLINQNELPNVKLSFKNPNDVNISSSINGQNLNYQNQNDNNNNNSSNNYTTEIYNKMNNINQQTNMNLHNSINMNNQYNNQDGNDDDNEINTSQKIKDFDTIQNNSVSILDTQNTKLYNNHNLPNQYSYNNNNYNNEPNKPFFNEERLSNIYTLLSVILTMGALGIFIYLISKYNLKIINFTQNGLNTITNPKKFFGEFILGNLLSLFNLLKKVVWDYLLFILFIGFLIVIFFVLKIKREKKIILNQIFEDIKRRLNEIFNSNNEYSMIGGIPEKDIIKIYSDKYNISYDVFNKNYMPYLRDMRRNNINIKIKEMNYKGENQLIWYWHE